MNINHIAKKSLGSVRENSPLILTGIGASGVVATAILSAKGGMRAKELLWQAETEQLGFASDPKERLLEKTKLTWKCYIPAASVGATTIAAIIASNSVSSRRTAAVTSLAAVTERAFKEYKDEVVKVLGEEKEKKVEDAVAAKVLADNPPKDTTVIVGSGDVLCYESHSGRYFKSTYESIRAAQNDVNARCINSVYASQNDFYKLLGLEPLPSGDELGWNTSHRLELRLTSTLSPEGQPAICLNYERQPAPNYYKGHGWM